MQGDRTAPLERALSGYLILVYWEKREMPDPEINYKEIRKNIGDKNSESIRLKGGNFRRKLRLAFDTQFYQYCANERPLSHKYVQPDGPWAGVVCGLVETVSAKVRFPEELEYIYALCELGRRGDAEIIDLPMVRVEKHAHQVRHGRYHGIERLDFDVPYIPYPIRCSRMKSYSSRIMTELNAKDDCERDVALYSALISHVNGKKQIRDVACFIQADMADVDVFISLDGNFIKPFRQIEHKLRSNGVRTLVMRPMEFCEAAELKPIPFPPPNPRQAMGTSPPER